MRPISPISLPPKIPLQWTERGNLIESLSQIQSVRNALVLDNRSLKNKEQFRVLCMTIGSLETFLLETGPGPGLAPRAKRTAPGQYRTEREPSSARSGHPTKRSQSTIP